MKACLSLFCMMGVGLMATPDLAQFDGDFNSGSPIELRANLPLGHNSPEKVRGELMDTNFVRLLVGSLNATDDAYRTFRISPGLTTNEVWVTSTANVNR